MNTNRNPNHTRIRRIVLIVLIVALLLVALGVFFVSRMLAFDENGAYVIDRYGILAQDRQGTTGSGSGDAVMEYGSGEPVREQEEVSAVTEDETGDSVRAIYLDADVLADTEVLSVAQEQYQAGLFDTVIVDIKQSGGELNIPLETDELDGEAVQKNNAEEIADGIRALCDSGISVIGRISCFNDQMAADQNADLAIQFENGGTWLDYDSKRWLDPTNPSAVGYVTDIAISAQELGCSEIMLTDFTFPPRGHIERAELDSNADSQTEVLLEDLKQIQKELSDTPVSLTAGSASELVDLSETAANEGLEIGEVGELLKQAEHIFVPAEDAAHIKEITAQLRELGVQNAIIPLFTDLNIWQEQSGSAVLDAVTGDSELADLEKVK